MKQLVWLLALLAVASLGFRAPAPASEVLDFPDEPGRHESELVSRLPFRLEVRHAGITCRVEGDFRGGKYEASNAAAETLRGHLGAQEMRYLSEGLSFYRTNQRSAPEGVLNVAFTSVKPGDSWATSVDDPEQEWGLGHWLGSTVVGKSWRRLGALPPVCRCPEGEVRIFIRSHCSFHSEYKPNPKDH